MADPRIGKLADILVNYSLAVQPQEWVAVLGDLGAMPLVVAVVERIAAIGAYPSIHLRSEDLTEALLKYGSDEVVRWFPPEQQLLIEQADAMMSLRASFNTRALMNIPHHKTQLANQARRPFQETYMRRTAEGRFRWVLAAFPTIGFAQEADMSLSEYEDFLYGATFATLDDPVAEWRRVEAEQARLIEWLKGKREVRLQGENIDLTLSIADRKFINASGRFNMPDGEIFTGPVESSAQGWMRFTYPTIRYGGMVEGVEFFF